MELPDRLGGRVTGYGGRGDGICPCGREVQRARPPYDGARRIL